MFPTKIPQKTKSRIMEKMVGRSPALNISFVDMPPFPWTIALGAVPGGRRNVMETAIEGRITALVGERPDCWATPTRIGMSMPAVAVFWMN